MSNLSLCMTFAILLQYNLKCVLGYSNPVYLINYGTLNFFVYHLFGTRHILAALTGSQISNPVIALNLSSQTTYLSCSMIYCGRNLSRCNWASNQNACCSLWSNSGICLQVLWVDDNWSCWRWQQSRLLTGCPFPKLCSQELLE